MIDPRDSAAATYGYLLVVDDGRNGFVGGLLVVCDRGRPLEFHCTEPVVTSPADRILYGVTLREVVCGEQIGGALLAKARTPIGRLLVTDEATAEAGRAQGVPTLVVDGGQPVPAELGRLAAAIDPAEPFERVREAIREAQRLLEGGDARAAA